MLFAILLRIIEFLINTLLRPFIKYWFKSYFRSVDNVRPLPKCSNDVLFLPASKLAEKIRNKEVKLKDKLLIKIYLKNSVFNFYI